MQVTDRFLGDLGRRSRFASAFEDPCGTPQQRPFPLRIIAGCTP
jgi:hypothetical protein